MPVSKNSRGKKWLIGVGAFFLLLVIAHLVLPVIIKNHVNRTLDELDGYTGSVEEIGLNLFRGAYTIKGLEILKEEDEVKIPFVTLDRIDLSIEWRALLKGSVVGEIYIDRPVVNFVGAKKGSAEQSQDGSEVDWVEAVQNLMPMKINQFGISDGEIHYLDQSTSPEIDLDLSNFQLSLANLSNAKGLDDTLPSPLSISAQSIGGGVLRVNGAINALKSIPDFDSAIEYEGADLTAFNDFSRAYANVDVEKGTMSVYSEVAARKGKVEGYIKPLLKDVEVFEWKSDNDGLKEIIWEGLVGGVKGLLENKKEDQVATKIPFTGSLENPTVGIWPTLWNIFRNAFIQAFNNQIDHTINFGQVGGQSATE